MATNFPYGLSVAERNFVPRGLLIAYWATLVTVVILLEIHITLTERLRPQKVVTDLSLNQEPPESKNIYDLKDDKPSVPVSEQPVPLLLATMNTVYSCV